MMLCGACFARGTAFKGLKPAGDHKRAKLMPFTLNLGIAQKKHGKSARICLLMM
jgi:hypothetical protein